MNALRRLIARKRIRRQAMIEVAIERHIRKRKPRMRQGPCWIMIWVTSYHHPRGWTCYGSQAQGTGFCMETAYKAWEDALRRKLQARRW